MIDEDIEDINWRTEVSQNRQSWQSPKHVDVASRNCSPRTYSTYSLISLEIWTVKVGSVYWCLVTGATQWNSWGNISVEELLSFIERGSATFFSTAPTKENRMTANAHQCPSMQFNYCKTPSPQERVWLVTLNICIHLYCVCVSVCPCVHVFHGVQSDPEILPGWWHQGGLEAKKIQEDPRDPKSICWQIWQTALIKSQGHWLRLIGLRWNRIARKSQNLETVTGMMMTTRMRPRKRHRERRKLAYYSYSYYLILLNFHSYYWASRMYPSSTWKIVMKASFC